MSSESSSNDPKSKEEIWTEIYQNAFQDREKASMLVTNLWKEITADPEKHILYGTTVSKYLERMAKSNDQLVKISTLLQKKESNRTGLSSFDKDEIFDMLQGSEEEND